MFMVLLSSLTLPLIYFFCDEKQLTYLLLWSKIDVSYTRSPMQGKMWWERAWFCSWLYLILCKSKFSFNLGAQLTESHERPCLQGFCAYEGVDVNDPSVGEPAGQLSVSFSLFINLEELIWFLTVLFMNVQVLLSSSSAKEGECRTSFVHQVLILHIRSIQSKSPQSRHSLSSLIIATDHNTGCCNSRSSKSW